MKFLIVLCATVACAFSKPGVLATGAIGYAAPSIAAPALAAPLAYTAPAVAAPLAYTASAVAAPAVAAPLAYAAPAVAAPAVAAPLAYAAPAVAAPAVAAPLAYAAPAVAAPAVAAPLSVKTQYHAQDVLGQASYGHAEPFQTHNAIQDAAGNKIGSFSYLSPEGNVFRTDYVADALGYRVASNALPVGPSLPLADTPEVAAAKAAHLAAKGATVIHRVRRQIIGHTPAATAPLAYAAAPLAYAAPIAAIRPGILTNIVNTPGHAVSYRVD